MKTRPTLERPKTLGHLRSINRNMIIHFANQSQTCQLSRIKKRHSFQTFHDKKLWKVVHSIPGWTDIENAYRLSRASYVCVHIYIYIYIYMSSSWLAQHFNDLCYLLPVYIGIYRVGDNKRTVNTSTTTAHSFDQLGTENAWETLLYWFIIIIGALVCDNMYRYGRHFGSFYRNPIILEMVSIA